ncbi:MAG: regulatory protein RecX [Steroidobacteraceae bacterium]|nr:regulatory protein RecX [Steroidobacteraceae bacterium]
MRKPRTRELDPSHAADPERVRLAAVTLLARRDYASGELRQKLEGQGYEAGAVSAALADLVASKIVDDARFAENYVTSHAARGHGPVRIAADLRALNLPAELIDAALAAGPDWRARAREVRIRRFGLEEPVTWAQKARQGRFLQYRGFSSDHIRAALGADFDPDE